MVDGKMEHSFSIEVNLKKCVKHISPSYEPYERVLFERITG